MFYNFFFDRLNKISSIIFLVIFTSLAYADVKIPGEQIGVNQHQLFKYPQSSSQESGSREIIPPPPPGPYTSSALRVNTTNQFGSGNTEDRLEGNFDAQNIPMETFSPEIPWPDDLRGSQSQLPEKNNSYIRPPVMKHSDRSPSSCMPARHRYEPDYPVNMSGMNIQRNTAMPGAPAPSNVFRQQNGYGIKHPPVYQYPTNNVYQQPGYQQNRNSYPVSNMPRYPY